MGILITCNPILAPTHPHTLRDAYVTPTPVTLPRLPTDDRSPQELEVFFGGGGSHLGYYVALSNVNKQETQDSNTATESQPGPAVK